MKFSAAWLETWVKPVASTDEIKDKLTALGLEVEPSEANIFDIAVPPNRGDCLSVWGIARELACAYQTAIQEVQVSNLNATSEKSIEVKLSAPTHCSRYCGQLILGIDPSKQTPKWMRERLESAGLSAISVPVDVTNYVMLELGQPLHAFDADRLSGNIEVRLATSKEKIQLLDETELELNPDDLIITDQSGPIALGGVMGGLESSVTENTRNVFLEAAHFDPVLIRATAKRYHRQTDASYRFERFVDPELCKIAIKRAANLLIEISGGQVAGATLAEELAAIPKDKKIKLRHNKIENLLGFKPSAKEIEQHLSGLGMQLETKADAWYVTPPSYRSDLNIEADLIEEVARLVGYQAIPTRLPDSINVDFKIPEDQTPIDDYKNFLIDRGYFEAITYSFISTELAQQFMPNVQLCKLQNPISDEMNVMRPSLWPGLVQAVTYNLRRQQSRIKLFEQGLSFSQAGSTLQQKQLAGAWAGTRLVEQWGEKAQTVDFFDLKAEIEGLCGLNATTLGIEFKAAKHPALHPGQTAEILKNGEHLGFIGCLHPQLQKSFDLTEQVMLFELDLNLLQKTTVPSFEFISKFPAIRRDLAVLIDKHIPAQQLLDYLSEQAGEFLQHQFVFDHYQGDKLPEGKKSVALGLVLQTNERTLEEVEVNEVINSLVEKLKHKFNAELR